MLHDIFSFASLSLRSFLLMVWVLLWNEKSQYHIFDRTTSSVSFILNNCSKNHQKYISFSVLNFTILVIMKSTKKSQSVPCTIVASSMRLKIGHVLHDQWIATSKHRLGLRQIVDEYRTYRQVSNINGTLVGNKIVDQSDVVGASPVGAAPTTSVFST